MDINGQATQHIFPTYKYAITTGRNLLAAQQAPQHTSEHDTDTANAEHDSSAPNITSPQDNNSNVHALATHHIAAVADAADQQAMQHGAGAINNRGLQRQLGQRFERSSGDQGSAQDAPTAGQMSPEALKLQSEITPGKGSMPMH